MRDTTTRKSKLLWLYNDDGVNDFFKVALT